MFADQNVFMCDVEGCQKIFFEVSRLREHALQDHANETFRKLTCAEAGKVNNL